MAGKERRWRRRKGGLLTAVCTCRKTGKMNRHAVFHTKASSCTTHTKSSNRVCLVVCYIARPVSNARGESELRKSFTSGWFLLYLEGKLLQGHTLFHTHWCWDSKSSSQSIQRETRNIKSLESFSRKVWMIQIKISGGVDDRGALGRMSSHPRFKNHFVLSSPITPTLTKNILLSGQSVSSSGLSVLKAPFLLKFCVCTLISEIYHVSEGR